MQHSSQCFMFAEYFTLSHIKKGCQVSIPVIQFSTIYCNNPQHVELVRNLNSLIIIFFRKLFFLSMCLEINASYDSLYLVYFKWILVDLPPNEKCVCKGQIM